MSYKSTHISIRFLRLALGAFFIILGITGLFPQFSESIFSLKTSYNWLEVVFGVVEIVCGALLILGFIVFSDARPIYYAGLVILVFWILRIALSKFIWGFDLIERDMINFRWLLELSSEIVIGLAVLLVVGRYDI